MGARDLYIDEAHMALDIFRFAAFFGDILGLDTYFLKPIFALKPWVRAGRFEYHEPHIRNNFFFRLIKGAHRFLTDFSMIKTDTYEAENL